MAMSQVQVTRNRLVLHLYPTASGVERNYYRSYQNEIIVNVLFTSINATFYNYILDINQNHRKKGKGKHTLNTLILDP